MPFNSGECLIRHDWQEVDSWNAPASDGSGRVVLWKKFRCTVCHKEEIVELV